MNNKVKIAVLAIVCVFVLNFNLNLANADPISSQTAQIVAEKWMGRVGDKRKVVEEKRILYDNEHPIGYLFSFSDDGFVIVPADDIFEPIKAWAKKGRFQRDDDNMMSLEMLVSRDLKKQRKVAKITRCPTVSHKSWELILNLTTTKPVASSEAKVIGPLLTTQWGQGYPYNIYCPINTDGNATVTCCVATAIAQIVRYWQYPDYGTGTKCYFDDPADCWYGSGSDQEICADFTHFYDWNAMPDTLSPNSSEEEIDAVARLMADIGVIAEICYSADGSYGLSQTVEDEMPAYLQYSEDLELVYDYRDNFFAIAKIELDKYWPMYFASDGHAYVADGYRIDLGMEQIHFNFGWDGNSSDGWYTLETLNEFWDYPEEIWVKMIINVHPEGITEPPTPCPPKSCFRACPPRPLLAKRVPVHPRVLQTVVVPCGVNDAVSIQPVLSVPQTDCGKEARLIIQVFSNGAQEQYISSTIVLSPVVVFDNFAELPECGTDLSIYPADTRIVIRYGYRIDSSDPVENEPTRIFDKLNGFVLLIE